MNPYFYFPLITLAGIGLLVWLSIALRRTEDKRAERIENLRGFDPIRTRGPETIKKISPREIALTRLGLRFTILRRTLFAVLVLIWLGFLIGPLVEGIPIASLSLFGAAGAVLLGIAARPWLENIIGGFVVSLSKQFRTGDTVLIDKEYGTIEDITPTHTVVKLWDWRRYVIPNSNMLTKEVLNYSTNDTFLWAKIEFYINYDADLELVKEKAVEVAKASPYFAGNEDPQMWIMRMDKDAIQCWLAAWAKSPPDAWALRVDMSRGLIQALAAAGIKTHTHLLGPFPTPSGPLPKNS